ncbi:Ferric/cupric reductase transmembrane component 7, partial [Lachnellula arida]
MNMGDNMMMGGAPSDSPLNASGIDFSNDTQASTFLGQILDDGEFQIDGNMYARNFWYGVCGVIGVCAVFNVLQKATFNTRMRAAAANKTRPASPSNFFLSCIACITAISREAGYAQYTPRNHRFFKVPPVGTITLLVVYLAWVILLEFVNNNVEGAQHFTSLGVRAAWLAVAQVPLLILLAGKNNLIGLATGVSYERLNVIHRWVSRVLLFLVTLHVIFLHLSWNAYDLGPLEYSTDSCIPTGWATYAILIWMNIGTIAPIRNFSYEFFVIQHIITFFGFIIAVMMHLPSTALYSRVYIYIPIALYLLDRLVRSGRYAWNNIRPGRATLTALEGGVTRVRVQSKAIKNWAPGSHVFLSIPKFGIGQSHPATIASTPHSHGGDLVFILKSHKGFTSRLLKSAPNSSTSLLPTEQGSRSEVSHMALIDGPYGNSHSDFAGFDSILLISGSTGTTFTLPILLDISRRAQQTKLPLKRITFLWIVKNTSWTSWTASELTAAAKALYAAGIELDIRIHVTCDENFTNGDTGDENKECGCACDKSAGPCCCVQVPEEDDDSDTIQQVDEKSVPAPVEAKKDAAQVNIQSRSQSPSPSPSSSGSNPNAGTKSKILPCATFHSGRPEFYDLLWDILDKAEGETGVAVCGPLGLSADVRRTVVRCSDERAVHKGTGAQGIYLHAECFG